MRSHAHAASRPPTLTSGKGFKASQAVLTAIAAGKEPSFPDHWNESDVRGVLYASFGRVCCYCGRELHAGDRGDVEHFRPKASVADDETHGGYFWLAYELTNYLLSCRTCNSSRKGTKFPVAAGQGRTTYETRGSIAAEGRLLLDPAADPIDDATEVDVAKTFVPLVAKGGTLRALVETSIEFFRLNIDPLLVKERFVAVGRWLELLDKGDVESVRRAASRYSTHGLAARSILIAAHKPLPTDDEELIWLAEALLEELAFSLALAAAYDVDAPKKYIDELHWALATLAKSPPRGQAKVVVDLLRNRGYYDRVEPYLLQLV